MNFLSLNTEKELSQKIHSKPGVLPSCGQVTVLRFYKEVLSGFRN